jgi:hypothetical protein
VLVCSAITREYLAHVRVLADSLFAADSEARLTVCVVDDPHGEVAVHPRVERLSPLELGVDRDEFNRLALAHPAHALASTFKPRLLKHLLGRGEASVTLLDADVCVYAPLRELDRLARDRGLVLSPHLHAPMVGPGAREMEAMLITRGTFNSGCVAVGAGALPFVDWWQSRTRDCVVGIQEGFFLEQLWLALVPGLFPFHVLEDQGFNVFGFNIGERDVVFDDRGPALDDGVRVLFFHFLCGFDPDRPEILSPLALEGDWPGWPSPGERPGLERLCREYAQRLLAAGYRDREPYRYGRLPDGSEVEPAMRAAYRLGLEAARNDGTPEPPNPFRDGEPDRFRNWLRRPPEGWPDQPVPWYVLGLRAHREDLRTLFPDVPGRHTGDLLGWVERAPGWGEPIWEELSASGAGRGSWSGGDGVDGSPAPDGAGPSGGGAPAVAAEQLSSLEAELSRLEAELSARGAALGRKQAALDHIHASRSWRWTAPLRRIAARRGAR